MIGDICSSLVARIPDVSFSKDEKGLRSSLGEFKIVAIQDLEPPQELQEKFKNIHLRSIY
jgi:hypothetical protein